MLKKIKEKLQWNQPAEVSVEDIDIVNIFTRKNYVTNEDKLKLTQYNSKKYSNGELIGVSETKDTSFYAFQDILFHFNRLSDQEKPSLIIMASVVSLKLSGEERELFRQKNKKVTSETTKQVLRIYHGSTHKPLSKSFYGKIDIPLDTYEVKNKNYEAHAKKFDYLLEYYSKVDRDIVMIVSKDEICKDLIEYLKNSTKKYPFCEKITVLENKAIKEVFTKITPYRKANLKIGYNILVALPPLIALYVFATANNTEIATNSTQNQKEIRTLNLEIKKASNEISAIKARINDKQILLEMKSKRYTGGEI